jgi:hypothetical protein
MSKMKITALEDTRSFYNMELKKEGLTERERGKYLKALKVIERVIEAKEYFRERRE